MIAITLAGESKRFFEKGYETVKYKLQLKNQSILESIFHFLPREEKILIILNKKFNDYKFVLELLKKLNFRNFKIVEIQNSKGQLDSLIQGINESKEFIDLNEPIMIYNGDTIRKTAFEHYNSDGFIECFIQNGDHWSFVDNLGLVNRVTEKKRISKYCSTGLYGFRSIRVLMKYSGKVKSVNGEMYIAPIYNLMIKDKMSVISFLTDKSLFLLCGTPFEYESNL